MRRNITLILGIVIVPTLSGCGGGGGGPDDVTVDITSPTQTFYTRADVTIQVLVSGSADRIELLKDGGVLVELAAPYQYTWDTTTDPEGSHEIVARAWLGGESVTSAPRTIIVDRTAPHVVARAPVPANDNVWVRDPIRVTFDEAILAETVNEYTVVLIDSLGVQMDPTRELAADGAALTLGFATPPSVPNTITAELREGITDLAGNPLVIPPDAWTWTFPEWVRLGDRLDAMPDDTAAIDPNVALAPDGTPVLSWSENDPSSVLTIQLRRWDGQAWQPFEGSPSGLPAYFMSMALDQAGMPVLAWSRYEATQYDVRVERFTGTGWNPLGDEFGVAGGSFYPSIAVDSTDAAMVAWYENDTTANADAVYVRRWDGAAWAAMGLPQSAVDGANTHARSPALVVGPAGDAVLAFWEDDLTASDVFVRSWSGSAWEPVGGSLDALAGAATHARSPAVAVDADGTPTVAWSESDPLTATVYVARWNGKAWEMLGAGLSALDDARSDALRPSIALDANGAPVVAWAEGTYDTMMGGYDGVAIHVRRWTGSTWENVGQTGQLKADAGLDNARTPSLVIADGVAPMVAWDEVEPGSSTNTSYIHIRRYNQ